MLDTSKASDRRRALTLVELLVVVALIGVLVAILLPALAAARAAANTIECKSNMRQLLTAFFAYVNDNQGTMPTNSQNLQSPQIDYWFGWTDGTFPETNRALDPARGLLTGYLGDSAASGLHCPSFPYDDPNFVPKFHEHAADYGLNIYLCPYAYQNIAYHLTQVKCPATTVILADGVQCDGFPSGSFNEAFYLGIDLAGKVPLLAPYGGFVHWRHPGQTANAAYVDGHVDQVQQQTGYVVTTIGGFAAGHLTSGDISATSPYGSVRQ